jgi:hypothetical protein
MKKLIGIAGRKRAGKDLVGQYLGYEFGFSRLAFADPLKEAAKIIFGWNEDHVNGDLKEVVDEFWGFSPRWALQRMGTEAMRKNVDDDIWIKATMRKVISSHVITDVRFPNEAKAIKEAGGVLWRIDRPSLGPAEDMHVSETALNDWDSWDAVIVNDGTTVELGEKVKTIMEKEHDRMEDGKKSV